MSDVNWLEMFGYFATVLTAVSLSMRSIVRLRWLNMAGSFCFGTYGLIIGAISVVMLNYYLTLMNIYNLWLLYREKAHFRFLTTSVSDKYLHEFIDLHRSEIEDFFPPFYLRDEREYVAMMIHRDLALAGVFICHKTDMGVLEVDLDFVLPPYRDLKPGQFVFQENKPFFQDMAIKRIISAEGSEAHTRYLSKIGFIKSGDKLELNLTG